MQDVTELLNAWSQGDREALDRLMPLVYDELRKLAVITCNPNGPAPPCNPLLWCMRLICVWSSMSRWIGRAGPIFSVSRRA